MRVYCGPIREIFMPPIVVLALGALAAGAIVHRVVKEVRRMNAELDRVKTARAIDPVSREVPPTLRRDPRTGDWRVM
jgi:hypothetical protein